MLNFILLIVLIICVVTDVKSRKIFNIITLPAIVAGFTYYLFTNGLGGFLYSGKGFLVGFSLLLIPFMMGGIGAGDVKLLAAVGAIKGVNFVFYNFIFAAIVGGAIAFFIMLRRRELKSFFMRMFYSLLFIKANEGSLNLDKTDLSPTIPYGVPIAIGALCTYALGGIL
ncbi:prepilin peptidase [Neobacillus niacini]|uniref:A24 family peptidase n=1 Tax=Neobacillus niacini TaxID=86668 RepID=UPI0007ABD64D|nr:prepilin peptidase [Neobacillus niacini]MEC1523504.1 prepilin peptidase [Neobacillus niacini]